MLDVTRPGGSGAWSAPSIRQTGGYPGLIAVLSLGSGQPEQREDAAGRCCGKHKQAAPLLLPPVFLRTREVVRGSGR